jgi:hypothetical integral membrane protein (TIGR02206 family)
MPARDFRPFTLLHIVCVAVAVVIWIALVGGARRRRGRPTGDSLRRATGWTILISAAASTIYELAPHQWNVDASLPLHLCDLAWWVSGAALIWPRRALQALLYYWGIGLSSEAFITPTLQYGPSTFEFWSFWVCHTQILAGSFLVIGAYGFRPSWRDCARTVIVTTLIFAAVTGVNLLVGSNYCFSAPATPGTPTVLDLLGPWPLRLLWTAVVVIALFVVMTVPFTWRRAGDQSAASG